MVEMKNILRRFMKKAASTKSRPAGNTETKQGEELSPREKLRILMMKKRREQAGLEEPAYGPVPKWDSDIVIPPPAGLDFMDGDMDLFDSPVSSSFDVRKEAPEKKMTEEETETAAGFKVIKCSYSLGDLPYHKSQQREHISDVTKCEVVHDSIRAFLDAGKLTVQQEKYPFEIILSDDTARLFTEDRDHCFYVYYEHPERIYLYTDSAEALMFKCQAIVGEEIHWLFSGISDLSERAKTIRTYTKLTPEQQAYVRRKAVMRAQSEISTKESHKPFLEKKQLKMIYSICRDTYSPEKRQKIEGLLEEASDYSRQSDALTQLSYLLGIDTCPVKQNKRTYDEIIAIMDKHIYGRQELKEMIAECIIDAQYTSAQYFSILLIGSPGVGKTNFCEALCEVFDCEQIFIDCGIIQPLDLFGLVRSYKDAQPSKVAKEFRALGHTNAVVILDEIDKIITEDRDGNGFSALLKPLGPQRQYHDDFLDDDIDVSNCKFVCTANDYNSIPDYIIDRFEGRVVFVSDYSYQEKAEIGKKFVLPRELREHHIDPSELTITDDALLLMAREYCSDKGAREITGNIRMIFRKVITEWERGLLSKPTVVDEAYVRSHLQKKQQATFGFSA